MLRATRDLIHLTFLVLAIFSPEQSHSANSKDQIAFSSQAEANNAAKNAGHEISNTPGIQEKANAVAHRIYVAYQTMYPEFVRNKQQPSVVVSTDSERNAWAYTDAPEANQPRRGLIVIPEMFMNDNIDHSVVFGILAHEMAHVLFWHQDFDSSSLRFTTRANANPTRDQIGAAERWIFLASIAGYRRHPVFKELPIINGFNKNLLDTALSLRVTADPICSSSLISSLKVLRDAVNKRYDSNVGAYAFRSHEEAESFDSAAILFKVKTEACLATTKLKDIDHVYHFWRGKLLSMQEAFALVSPEVNISPDRSAFEALLEVNRIAHAEMDRLHSQYDLKSIRRYTLEDQAEEMALSVLKFLKLDVARYTADLFVSPDFPNAFQKCEQTLKKGLEPTYGSLGQLHHAPCWRFWRNQNFSSSPSKISELN